MNKPNFNTPFFIKHGSIIAKSFHSYLGHNICEPIREHTILDLWEAPFALVSHGTQSDPIFNFANKVALSLFEMNFVDFTQLPSKYSAEPITQDERNLLLSRVREHGYIDNYSGIRVSSTGKRFHVNNAIVFNLIDENHQNYGQAALLENWNIL